jgi:thioredoxin reductase (NADPH)
MENSVHNLIILGSGPAGLTAAIYAARGNLKPIVIDGGIPGGQLMGTTYVENWPGEKSILGFKLMQNMREHAQHFGTQFISETVTKVDFSKKPFTIWTDQHKELHARSIIIATGAVPKKLGCPGEKTYWGKGITTCAVCDGAFYVNKKVLVVGGGDTAMEDASFLKKFTNDITIVQIEEELTASHAMQQRIINDKDITIIYSSTITEIHGDNDHVTGVTIANKKTNEQKKIDIDGVFVAIGLNPSSEIFKNQLAMKANGYLEISDHTKSSVEGVFIAGDVADYRYRQAITSAGSGCMAALDVERYLKQ